jgi:hypothetical protein
MKDEVGMMKESIPPSSFLLHPCFPAPSGQL